MTKTKEKMKKLVRLTINITAVSSVMLDDHCNKLNLSRSALFYESLIFYLKNKGYKKLESELKIDSQRSIIREQNHRLYLIKNTFMTMINMAKMDLLLHSEINMSKVESTVKECKKLYNCYSSKIKKLLKDDMKQLESLRSRHYLMQFMNNWDLISEFLIEKKSTKKIELK